MELYFIHLPVPEYAPATATTSSVRHHHVENLFVVTVDNELNT